MAPRAATWFDGSKDLPAIVNADYLFGGTQLLESFFAFTSELRGGVSRLLIAAPFIDESFVAHLGPYRTSDARAMDLVLLTTPDTAKSSAVSLITSLPWRSCEIRSLRSLHAKIYILQQEGRPSRALIGSHNLTAAATYRNIEAGVLVTGNHSESIEIVASVTDSFLALRNASTVVYDSFTWSPNAPVAAA